MAEIVGEELAHTAYRRCSGDWPDEIDGRLGLGVLEVEEMIAVPLPFGCMACVTLRRSKKFKSVKIDAMKQQMKLTRAKSRVKRAPQLPPQFTQGRIML